MGADRFYLLLRKPHPTSPKGRRNIYGILTDPTSQFSIKSLLSLRLLPFGEAGRGFFCSPCAEPRNRTVSMIKELTKTTKKPIFCDVNVKKVEEFCSFLNFSS